MYDILSWYYVSSRYLLEFQILGKNFKVLIQLMLYSIRVSKTVSYSQRVNI